MNKYIKFKEEKAPQKTNQTTTKNQQQQQKICCTPDINFCKSTIE